MKTTYFTCLICLILGLSSCFHMVKDMNGKKHLIRIFNDPGKREAFYNQKHFKHCSCNSDSLAITQIPTSKINSDYVYYESRGGRIYLSPFFYWGFLGDSAEAYPIYNAHLKDYDLIFSNGLIDARSFFCQCKKDCEMKNNSSWIIVSDSGTVKRPELFGYSGPVVKILNIQDVTQQTKAPANKKRLEIWASQDVMESGWGSFSMYLLELQNDKAHKNTGWHDFILGAKVSCFLYKGTQI